MGGLPTSHRYHDAALQHKTQPFHLLHSPNSLFPIMLPCSPHNALPCFWPIFTRRTSGHCVGTLRPVLFLLPSYSLIIIILNVEPLAVSSFFLLSLSLSQSKPQKGLNAKMDCQPGSCSESDQSPNSSLSPSP